MSSRVDGSPPSERYVGEYTSPEIGEMLGTSAGTERVQLHRAHAALRQSITEAEHA